MKYLIAAKITTVEWCRNPLEIEAETEKEALEKANEILENDSDQIYMQKLDVEENDLEFSIEDKIYATTEQCPYCLAEDIGTVLATQEGNHCTYETLKCYTCEKKWVDVYTLSRRENGHAEIIQTF